MNDLRERLQEAAVAAAREGRRPSTAELAERGRRRRLHLAGGNAALLALALLAVVVGADRLAERPVPLAPSAPTRRPTVTPTTSPGPDVSTVPDPGPVEQPVGAPPGKVGQQMVRDVATELARCRGGDPDEKILVAWGRAHGQTWLIEAKPPRPGENWLCWATGLFDASGAGSVGMEGGPDAPLKPIQAGERFPVNFYVGFYRQPEKDQNLEWWVTRVIALDQAGRTVAECQATAGPGSSC